MQTVASDRVTSVEGGNSGSRDSNVENHSLIKSTVSKTNQSFANVLKENSYTFPDREQGFLFDAVGDLPKNEFIIGVGELIGPKNIIFASRVSNSRICIYLKSKDVVENFLATHGGITIGEKFFLARRLVSSAKRVIISNVSPSLPHEIIERELKGLSLKCVSPITFISAGLSKPEYKHILSFRRQVYILLENNVDLPNSLLVEHKDTAFRIFLATDEIKCFICKKAGHIASKCPSKDRDVQIVSAEIHPPPSHTLDKGGSEGEASSNIKDYQSSTPSKGTTTEKDIITIDKKRPAPSSSGSESSKRRLDENKGKESVAEEGIQKEFVKPILKKKKEENGAENKEPYEEFRPIFDEGISFISFDNFCKFIGETKGKQDIIPIALKYGPDIDSLKELVIAGIRTVKTNALRARLKRILKKILPSCIPSDHPDFFSSQEDLSSDASTY